MCTHKRDEWYLDEVTVEVPSHGELMVFPCHRWLAEDKDDGKIERKLYHNQHNNINQSKIVSMKKIRGSLGFLL